MLGLHRHNREQALAGALAASLDAVRDGVTSIDQCLSRYEEFAAELEPLLRVAARVQAAGRIEPADDARATARFVLLQAAAAKSRPAPIAPLAVVRRRSWLALAPAAMAALLFAAIAVPVLGSVDANAVPGNWNYSFKRATERVRLALATDSTDRRLLRLEFARRRLNEIERLSSQGHVDNHASEVASLLKDYTADLNQVTNTTQAQGQIPPAVQQQIEALTPKADAVIQPIVQNAADDKKEVKSAAQDAAVVTRQAQTVAQTLPTTSTTARVVAQPATQVSPTHAAASATSATPAPTEPPTASPTPAAATATATGTPPVGVTATPTTTATATQQAVPTREAAVFTPVLPTPTATATVRPATSPAAGNDVLTPVPTPGVDRTVTPASGGSVTARPAATSTPVAAAAATTPARTPSASATRSASIEAGLVVVGRSPDEIRYQWSGPADSLANIIAPLGSAVVYVTYQAGNLPTTIWYPGTPAPVIATNQLITVKLKTLTTPAAGSTPAP